MSDASRPRRRPVAALAAAAAALLLATSCTGDPTGGGTGASDDGGTSAGASDDGGEAGGSTPALAELGTSAAQDLPTDPAEDEAYAAYYQQTPEWEDCRDEENQVDRLCTTITVPKVWNDPAQGDIELALAKVPSSGEGGSSLVMNPGGPGGSGVDFVSVAAAYYVSDAVKQEYDLVSFDPRGVSRSEGIRCFSDEELSTQLDEPVDPDASAEEHLQQSLDYMKKLGDGCQEKHGDLLPYLDTYSAARDMDVVRAVLGSERLDYFGYSYGTYLGATFADLYPQRVGRMVLDGAIDPEISLDGMNEGQTAGFEAAITRFLEDCAERGGEDCPFRGSAEDAEQQLLNLLDQMSRSPLPTDDPQGREATGSHAANAVILSMYEDGLWPQLRLALKEALAGDGSLLLDLADMSASRNDDGTFEGNSAFAINAVNCLDHPGIADRDWQRKRSEELAEKYPMMGENAGYGAALCEQWPVGPMREPAPISADGAPEIVVIGTTGDPATPYQWSVALADQLSSGVLVSYEGNGHTAYGRSGGCVEEAVDAFLLGGAAPEDGLVCSSPAGTAPTVDEVG